jgi:hypothetical protein
MLTPDFARRDLERSATPADLAHGSIPEQAIAAYNQTHPGRPY